MDKCIVIPDSFKGSLGSIEICEVAKKSIQKFYPKCEVITLPVADGGEGTVDCFLYAMGGKKVKTVVKGPYMEEVETYYGRVGDTAIIEMAAAAGLTLVGSRKDPSLATTFGVGEQMLHAAQNGAKEIILGLGGSGTNDGGCGCVAALGVIFTDEDGKEFVPRGKDLDQIRGIDLSLATESLKDCSITAMCDVDNSMHGVNGAAYVFAPQKGADDEMVRSLDEQLLALDEIMQSSLGGESVSQVPGAGAAGAMGAGMLAFLGAELKPGIDTVLKMLEFDEKLEGADLVITGEGKIDGQSLRGKVVYGVAKRAKIKNVPVIALVGDVADDAYGIYEEGVSAIFSINRLAVPFKVAKTRSRQDYKHTLEDILRLMTTFS